MTYIIFSNCKFWRNLKYNSYTLNIYQYKRNDSSATRLNCNSASRAIIIQSSLIICPIKNLLFLFFFFSFFFFLWPTDRFFLRHLIQGDGRSMKTRLCVRGWLKLGVHRYPSFPGSAVFCVCRKRPYPLVHACFLLLAFLSISHVIIQRV